MSADIGGVNVPLTASVDPSGFSLMLNNIRSYYADVERISKTANQNIAAQQSVKDLTPKIDVSGVKNQLDSTKAEFDEYYKYLTKSYRDMQRSNAMMTKTGGFDWITGGNAKKSAVESAYIFKEVTDNYRNYSNEMMKINKTMTKTGGFDWITGQKANLTKADLFQPLVKQADKSSKEVTSVFDQMGGHIVSRIKFMVAQMIAVFVLTEIASHIYKVFEDGFQAVEKFKINVMTLAAVITTFMKPKSESEGGLAAMYKEAHDYAEGMVPIIENMGTKIMMSGQHAMQLVTEFAKMGVFLDANNQKQMEGFQTFANALAKMTQGQAIEKQILTEVRALFGQGSAAGAVMLKMLQATTPNLKEQLQIWRDQGTVLENMKDRLKGFDMATGEVKDTWLVTKNVLDTIYNQTLRGGLLPMYTKIIEKVQDLSKWIKEHQSEIQSGLYKAWLYIQGAIENISTILEALSPILKPILFLVGEIAIAFGHITYVELPVLLPRIMALMKACLNWVRIVSDLGLAFSAIQSGNWSNVWVYLEDAQKEFKEAGTNSAKAFESGFEDETIKRNKEYFKIFKDMTNKVPSVPKSNVTEDMEAMKKVWADVAVMKEGYIQKDLSENQKWIERMNGQFKTYTEDVKKYLLGAIEGFTGGKMSGFTQELNMINENIMAIYKVSDMMRLASFKANDAAAKKELAELVKKYRKQLELTKKYHGDTNALTKEFEEMRASIINRANTKRMEDELKIAERQMETLKSWRDTLVGAYDAAIKKAGEYFNKANAIDEQIKKGEIWRKNVFASALKPEEQFAAGYKGLKETISQDIVNYTNSDSMERIKEQIRGFVDQWKAFKQDQFGGSTYRFQIESLLADYDAITRKQAALRDANRQAGNEMLRVAETIAEAILRVDANIEKLLGAIRELTNSIMKVPALMLDTDKVEARLKNVVRETKAVVDEFGNVSYINIPRAPDNSGTFKENTDALTKNAEAVRVIKKEYDALTGTTTYTSVLADNTKRTSEFTDSITKLGDAIRNSTVVTQKDGVDQYYIGSKEKIDQVTDALRTTGEISERVGVAMSKEIPNSVLIGMATAKDSFNEFSEVAKKAVFGVSDKVDTLKMAVSTMPPLVIDISKPKRELESLNLLLNIIKINMASLGVGSDAAEGGTESSITDTPIADVPTTPEAPDVPIHAESFRVERANANRNAGPTSVTIQGGINIHDTGKKDKLTLAREIDEGLAELYKKGKSKLRREVKRG